MDTQEKTFERLLALEDVWAGEGRAEYPTIATFRYREALTVQAIPGQPRFFVLQRTQKKNDAGEWVESHWESGFLRVLADGSAEWLDAQNGGRVEVLRGMVAGNPDGFDLTLMSALVGNDARMGETARQFELRGDGLTYTMQMSMQHTPVLTMHLTAGLARFVDKATLLARMADERARFLELAATLTPDAHPGAEWSVRDVIAHYIAHEQRARSELEAARRGERSADGVQDGEALNAEAVRSRRGIKYDALMEEWDASYGALRSSVEELSEADFDPFSPLCVALEDTVDGSVANNSYAHYLEHRLEIERRPGRMGEATR